MAKASLKNSIRSYYLDNVMPSLLDAFKDAQAFSDHPCCRGGHSLSTEDLLVGRSLSEWETRYAMSSKHSVARSVWFNRPPMGKMKTEENDSFPPSDGESESALDSYLYGKHGSPIKKETELSLSNTGSNSYYENHHFEDIYPSVKLKLQTHLAAMVSRFSIGGTNGSECPSIVHLHNSISTQSYKNANDSSRLSYLTEFKEAALKRLMSELDMLSSSSSTRTSGSVIDSFVSCGSGTIKNSSSSYHNHVPIESLFPEYSSIKSNFNKIDILKRIFLQCELSESFNRICVGRDRLLGEAIGILHSERAALVATNSAATCSIYSSSNYKTMTITEVKRQRNSLMTLRIVRNGKTLLIKAPTMMQTLKLLQ